MNAAEMHIWFRQYAQQMGLQNVRAILPEQIDLVINTSISDTINQIVRENISLTNDRIITDNSKIGQINALRTLYKVKELNITTDLTTPATFDPDHQDIIYYPVRVVDEGDDMGLFRCTNFTDKQGDIEPQVDALYLVDLAIQYIVASDHSSNKKTGYFPVRIIDDMYLADTMQDYVLKPRVRTPIAVVYNNQLDLYLGEGYGLANGKLKTEMLVPSILRVSYLARPAKVTYLSDVGGTDVDCDLPESMHVDILKHAVDLYNISIQGGLHAAQQQQRNQNQEVARNTTRPDNEGYQQ